MYIARYETPGGLVALTALRLIPPDTPGSPEAGVFRELVEERTRETLRRADVRVLLARRLGGRSEPALLVLSAESGSELALRRVALEWHGISQAVPGTTRTSTDAADFDAWMAVHAGAGIGIRNDPETRAGVVFHPRYRLGDRLAWLENGLHREGERGTVCWRFRRYEWRDVAREIRLGLVALDRDWVPEDARRRHTSLAAELEEGGLVAEEFLTLGDRDVRERWIGRLAADIEGEPAVAGFPGARLEELDDLAPDLLAAEGWLGEPPPPRLGQVCSYRWLASLLDSGGVASPTGGGPPTGRPDRPLGVFVSYAHEDRAFAERLSTSCAVLRREGWIDLWTDAAIVPGDDWRAEIDRSLETADVVLLLVSPDFLDSDFCYGIEMRRALERHAAGEAAVVPVHVRWSDVAGAPFRHLQGLPAGLRPVSAWPDADAAWLDVVSGLRRLLEQIALDRNRTREIVP